MRISLVPFLVQIVMLVAASPVAELETRADDTCHGGDTYCCNSSPVLGDETTGFLPVPINVLLGLQCSPLTVLGIVLGTTWYVPPLVEHRSDVDIDSQPLCAVLRRPFAAKK